MSQQDVLRFWFEEIPEKKWFVPDPAFDRQLADHFAETHKKACRGELFEWRETPDGRLAEIIVLDQFSRNLFRHQSKAFEQDGMALVLAQEAIRNGAHLGMASRKKSFLFMPFMHSESKAIHEVAAKLFSEPGLEHNFEYELQHKRIIDRFGRYPHRNAVLGRPSTPEETQFLKEPDSSF